MKHTKHNAFRRLAAIMLTLMIALTGISYGDTMTAQAKVLTFKKDRTGLTDARELANTTVTMKVGDEMMIDLINDYGYAKSDVTDDYAWSTSNENVVTMMRSWEETDAQTIRIHHVIIKAEKAGTAVISATNRTHGEVSFTVNVKAPKVTAKQKKCRHTWKTTKKATCVETGVKTCKKCKLQKSVARKDHKFKTVTEERYDTVYETVYQCAACINEDPEIRKQHFLNSFLCEDWCEEEFATSEYGSKEAARTACNKHKSDCKHGTGVTKYRLVPVGKKVSYKDVNVCTGCDQSDKEIDLIYNVNDPYNPTWIKDL